MRILITDGMDKCAVKSLCDAGWDVVEQDVEPDVLGAALQEFDVVIVQSKTEIRALHLDEAEEGELKLIVCAGAETHNVDAWYAEKKGIAVFGVPSVSSAINAQSAEAQARIGAEIVSIITSFFNKEN